MRRLAPALATAWLALGGAAPARARQDPPPAPAVAEEGAPVRSVRFEGDTQTTEEALLLQVRTKAGTAYSRRIADEDLKILAARFQLWGEVIAVPLPDGGVEVVFRLRRQAAVARVLFRGNSKLEDDDLREALGLSENNTIAAGALRGGALAVLVRKLADKYQEEGYLFAEIEPRPEQLGDEHVLTFDIIEGPEVSVDDIEFVGRYDFDEDDLKEVMRTSETFLWVFEETYVPRTLEDDVVQVEQLLRDEGWLDARVAIEEVIPDRDAEEVDLVLRVEQGERYVVRSVKFVGNDRFSTEELMALVKMRPGMPYRQTIYRKDRARILRHCGRVGYIRAEMPLRPLESYAEGRAEIDVVYRLSEDEPKRVRDVRVVGNVNTKDAVVRRELDLHPGDLFDGDELRAAEDRLRASGFFADERGTPLAWVETQPTEDPRAEDVVMTVEEGTAGVITFFGGVASGTGFFLGTDVTIDNFDLFDLPSSPGAMVGEFFDQKAFHGDGQRLRFRANPGNQYSNYLIQFTEPYLTGPISNPFFLDLDFHLREFRSRYYDQETIGGSVQVGKRLSRRQSVSAGLRQDRIEIEDIVDRADPIEDLLAVEGGNSVRAFFLEWEHRAVDSLRNPTEGWRLGATAEWLGGPLGAQVDAFKSTLSGELLIPVYENEEERRHVASLRGSLAWGRAYGDSDDIPIFERFYAGGPGGFLQGRGFQYRGIGPHDGDFSLGGNAGWMVNSEYVFPLVDIYNARLREDEPFLRGILFADQGMLESHWGGLQDGTWRLSVGAGIRLRIPFQLFSAPLELYYGIPIRRASEDERESFQINFSTRF